MLTDSEKARIISAIQSKVPSLQCPMCHHDHFILVDGYITNSLQDRLGEIKFGGHTMPLVAIACEQCGHISFHSVGLLGLFTKKEGNSTEVVKSETEPKSE